MFLFHSTIWTLYLSHALFHIELFSLERLLPGTAVQCTEKPEIGTRHRAHPVFASRYEFIAGVGCKCLEFYRLLSALEMAGRRSVSVWRGDRRELRQICFATHTFYVFYFIKDRKRDFSAIYFGS